MNAHSSLPFLTLLEWFVFAMGMSALCYASLSRARRIGQERYFFLGLACCVALYVKLSCTSDKASILILVGSPIALLASVPSAYCEQALRKLNAARERDEDWGWDYCISLLTAMLSLVAGSLAAVLLESFSLSVNLREPLWRGLLLGLVAVPPSISFFRWMLPNLRLRPGIDRPLRPSERP